MLGARPTRVENDLLNNLSDAESKHYALQTQPREGSLTGERKRT